MTNRTVPGRQTAGADGADRADAEDKLRKLTHDLTERVKELSCLYGISRLVEKRGSSLDFVLQGAVELIPPAWQYPEVTCACIKLRDRIFKTENFGETGWRQAETILVNGKEVGTLEVYYLKEEPHAYEGPFLKEERDLIHGIAERLGRIMESKIAEGSLRRIYAREEKLLQKLKLEMQSRIDFTRLLVHELKTPLTSLMATSQLLMEETRDTRLEKLGRYVWEGASGLNMRIEELHDVVRGEIGILKLEPKPVNIEELLLSLVEETRASSHQYGISINLEMGEPLPKVNADAQRVRQIMLNLINNVYKYAAEGGELDIRAVRSRDSMLLVEVRDHGPGIPRERQRLLFKPGYRSSTRDERPSGLGIGLVLCKTLVELHGGRIWFESKAGRGSSFFFTLPVVA